MTWTREDIKKLVAAKKIKGFTESGKGDAQKKPGRSKYGNKKVVVDGIKFDSKKEANRYFELKTLQLAGKITGLTLQRVYYLTVEGRRVAKYIADFEYYENGVIVAEDVKSLATRKNRVYRLKKKLMKVIYGIEIRET